MESSEVLKEEKEGRRFRIIERHIAGENTFKSAFESYFKAITYVYICTLNSCHKNTYTNEHT